MMCFNFCLNVCCPSDARARAVPWSWWANLLKNTAFTPVGLRICKFGCQLKILLIFEHHNFAGPHSCILPSGQQFDWEVNAKSPTVTIHTACIDLILARMHSAQIRLRPAQTRLLHTAPIYVIRVAALFPLCRRYDSSQFLRILLFVIPIATNAQSLFFSWCTSFSRTHSRTRAYTFTAFET